MAGGERMFGGLEALLLGANRIHSWASVDALDRLPSLRDVRLSDNPLPGAPQELRSEVLILYS